MKNRVKFYRSISPKLSAHISRSETMKIAWKIYHREAAKTRRTPYIRTNKKSYFKGQKVFINLYFPHLNQKNSSERIQRLCFLEAGIDLIKHTNIAPVIKKNPNNKDLLLRFYGRTADGYAFCVQIRKNDRGNHYLMSTFPYK